MVFNRVQEIMVCPYKGFTEKPMERLVQCSTITAAGAIVHKNIKDHRIKNRKLSMDAYRRSEEIRQDYLSGKMSKKRAEAWLENIGVKPAYLHSSAEEKAYLSSLGVNVSSTTTNKEKDGNHNSSKGENISKLNLDSIHKNSFQNITEESMSFERMYDQPLVEIALPNNSFLIPEKKITLCLDGLLTLTVCFALIGIRKYIFKDSADKKSPY